MKGAAALDAPVPVSAPALPILQGPRVVLRAMTVADITPQHVGWLNDPLVVQFSNQRFVSHTQQSGLRYLASFEGTTNIYASIRLGAVDGPRIGTMTAYRNMHHGTADIGILMGERAVWGQGLGREAFALLADWLAAQPGMRKLTCGTLACNRSMLSAARAAGFAPEAVRSAHELVAGEPVDLVYFARFCSKG